MKLLQILQKCLEDWKNISHLDFCLVNLDNTIYISTCDRAFLPKRNWKNLRK